MADKDQILIEVQFDTKQVDAARKALAQNVNELRDNKKELQALQKEVDKGNALTDAGAKRYAELNAKIDENKRAIKSNTAIIQASTAERATENDSLDAQRQYLLTVQKAFAGLTKEQKDAMGGEKELSKAIKAANDSLVAQEHAIGENGRNVGNYTESILKASEQAHGLAEALKATGAGSSALGKGVDSVDKTMKVFSKNPIMGVLSLLAPLLAKIANLVSENKALMAAVDKVLKPLGDALGWVADLIGNVLVGALDALSSAWNAVSDFFGEVASWFGGGSAIKESTAAEEEAARAAAEYAKQVANLTAQLDKEQKALTKLQKDNKFHINLMKAAGRSQKEINEQRLQDMQEELDAQRKIYKDAAAALHAFDQQMRAEGREIGEHGGVMLNKEDAERFNELKKQRDDAYAALNDQAQEFVTFQLQMQTDAHNEAAAKEKEAAEKRKAERQRQYEEERAEWVRHITDLELLAEAEAATLAAKEQELRDQAQKMLASLDESEEEEEIPTPDEMARDMFGLDAEGVEYFKSLLDEGVSIAEAKTKAISAQTVRMAKSWATSFGNLGSAFTEMGDMLGEFSDDSKAAADAQKAFALSGIILNQAQSIANGALAISEGVASAASIPYPANIPAIISIVAQIAALMAGVGSSIAQAKNVFKEADAQKMEHGGIVEGTSYTGDHVPVLANSREMMLPMDAQKNLFDALSSNSDGTRTLGFDYELMAAANAALPAPVMDYTEFKTFDQKVSTFNEIASI